MGGKGSGNWYRAQTKTTTNEVIRLDIRFLKKHGHLAPGYRTTLRWSQYGRTCGRVQYHYQTHTISLNYRVRTPGTEWQVVEQTIRLDRTRCNYGGERTWLLCPQCSRRMALLYFSQSRFLCRHCHQLPYASQQRCIIGRTIEQKHNLGERIFERYEHGEDYRKKKGMHRKTFNRLLTRYLQLDEHCDRLIMGLSLSNDESI